MKKRDDAARLELWKSRLARSESEYSGELDAMDHREALYRGTPEMFSAHTGEETDLTQATHVRNIVAEIIEAQVDTNIPQPKVTARRPEDEPLARIVEDMLRSELDRMRFETFNDQSERTVPIQGGGFWLVEWDNAKRTHQATGEVCVSVIHPKQVIPQAGVYDGVESMDYVILKLPQTKAYILRKYGVSVEDETESDADVRGPSGESSADDMVTQYVAYYRNEAGGIGLFSWVNDVVVEDLRDYQARRLRRCTRCGALEPPPEIEPMGTPTVDGTPPETDGERHPRKKAECPYCGGTKWEPSIEEFEELYADHVCSDGKTVIPGGRAAFTPDGRVTVEPTRIPYYKPDIFPVILEKNVSVFGRLLGDSDVDKIEYQQNTIKWLSTSMNDKLVKYGSFLILPRDAKIGTDAREGKVIRIGRPDEVSMIGVRDMNIDIEQDMVYAENVYEQARQVIGITDSFQGRRDTTATSGKAKEFAAQQSAGRLESKRVMKHAAYAELYEAIFKFKLAYTDEPRPVSREGLRGERNYEEFDRYLFLRQDEAGEWYWNDDFLFSCDTAASLATNREAMWQEARLNLQSYAFGNPQEYDTLVLFWSIMQKLHYPYADAALQFVQQRAEAQRAAQEAQQQAQQAQQAALMQQETKAREDDARRTDAESESQKQASEQQIELDTIRQAQADARADVLGGGGGGA